MTNNKNQDQALAIITKAAEEVAGSFGFTLVDAHFGLQGRKTILEIAIYKPGGRIGLSDCESVSRELDARLEAMKELPALLHGPYILDVASPGIDRVLKKDREYTVFAGAQVEIKTKSDVGAGDFGQHFVATLKGLCPDHLNLELSNLKEMPKQVDKAKAGKNGKGKAKSKADKFPAPEPVNELKVPLKQISQVKLYADFSKAAEKEIDLDACDEASSEDEALESQD